MRSQLKVFVRAFAVLAVLLSVVFVGATTMNEFASGEQVARALAIAVSAAGVLAIFFSALGYEGRGRLS